MSAETGIEGGTGTTGKRMGREKEGAGESNRPLFAPRVDANEKEGARALRTKLKTVIAAVIATAALTTTSWACGGMDHSGGEHGGSHKADTAKTAETSSLETLLKPYFSIRAALSSDTLDGVASNTADFIAVVTSELDKYPEEKHGIIENVAKKAKPLAKKGLKIAKFVAPCAMHAEMAIDQIFPDGAPERGMLQNILDKARPLAGNNITLKNARTAFGELGDALTQFIRANAGTDVQNKYQLFYCSMEKRYWLQPADEAAGNPFLGKEMPGCGEKTAIATTSGGGSHPKH